MTFLTREQLEFMDKLEKDAIFSTGKCISRSQIIQDMAELLSRTNMTAEGIRTNDELKERMLEAIVRIKPTQASITQS